MKLKKIKGWQAPLGIDRGASLSEGKTAQLYGVSGYPTIIIIDRDGKVGFNSAVEPKDRAALLGRMDALAKSHHLPFPSEKDGHHAEAEKQANAIIGALLSEEIDHSLGRRTP
jgi:hypothetical protein